MTGHLAAKAALALWAGADRLRPPRRVSRKRAALIASLDNDGFVRAATAAARRIPGSHPRFGIDNDGLFRIDDGQPHFFAHKSRVYGYLGGLKARGRQLAREYLLAQVPFSLGDHIVEVGANVGDLALALVESGAQVHVTAFEPSPREFRCLEKNLAASPAILGFDARNAAVWSDDTEEMVFYVKSETADSSILPIEDYDEKIAVPTVRLDTVLERRPYRLLKLEAEGAEPEILAGAEGLLDCFEYITADVGFERGLKQESTLPQVTDFLVQRGFRIEAVARDRLVLLFRNTRA